MGDKVTAVPEGFHTATPYLIVRNGAEAIEFYKQAFGMMEAYRHADPDGRVRNAELRLGTSNFMLGEHSGVDPRGQDTLPRVSIYLYVEDADAVFAQAVAAGAKVLMAVDQKFYGNREGGIEDPYGIVWWIATRVSLWSPGA
ncbi:MAG TPA: VOC family protein [Paludibaculum sp.]|jgi:PhnB protein